MGVTGQLITKTVIKILFRFLRRCSSSKTIRYLGFKNVVYNNKIFQNYDDPPICGHLCLIVLEKLSKGVDYVEILKGNLSNAAKNLVA